MCKSFKIALAAAVAAVLACYGPLAHVPAEISRSAIAAPALTTNNPKYSGYTRDGCRYELTADTAKQESSGTGGITLEQPRASLEMPGGKSFKLRAVDAVLDSKTAVVTMRRDVVLNSDSGHEIRMREAAIDMRNGTIVSEQPIEIKLEQRTLRANRLEVNKSGYISVYDGTITESDNVIRFDSYILQ